MRMTALVAMLGIILLSTAALLVFFSLAIAEVPHLINYQGALTDSDGLALSGLHYVTFGINPDSSPFNLKIVNQSRISAIYQP